MHGSELLLSASFTRPYQAPAGQSEHRRSQVCEVVRSLRKSQNSFCLPDRQSRRELCTVLHTEIKSMCCIRCRETNLHHNRLQHSTDLLLNLPPRFLPSLLWNRCTRSLLYRCSVRRPRVWSVRRMSRVSTDIASDFHALQTLYTSFRFNSMIKLDHDLWDRSPWHHGPYIRRPYWPKYCKNERQSQRAVGGHTGSGHTVWRQPDILTQPPQLPIRPPIHYGFSRLTAWADYDESVSVVWQYSITLLCQRVNC